MAGMTKAQKDEARKRREEEERRRRARRALGTGMAGRAADAIMRRRKMLEGL